MIEITAELLDGLERSYTPAEDQKCVICGAPLQFSASDRHGSRWNCSSDDANPVKSTKPYRERMEHYDASSWYDRGQTFAPVAALVQAYRDMTLPELRWAPYQEFGIPDQAWETTEPPSTSLVVKATGYRGNVIIVYWAAP
jgi:hypothetical protein